jgi:hypothetical protein
VIELAWVLTAGIVVGGAIVLWFGDALVALESPWGRRPDRRACAGCRHDAVAHERADAGSACTQCPCSGFRRSC